MTPAGLVVSVGYDDLLSLTLPLNLRHLASCLVVTSPDDARTAEVARRHPGVEVFVTDAFTRPGPGGTRPRFNKGRAIEEALDHLGRRGWILIWDADTAFPDRLHLGRARTGRLHGARRRVLDDPARFDGTPGSWRLARPQSDDACVGFFQLFDCDDPAIRGRRPWYNPTFAHAGGCDDYFARHWPATHRVVLPITTLHLGPVATNWYGRASMRLDGTMPEDAPANLAAMDALIKRYDWHWARPGLDMDAIADDPAVPHRVAVPGFEDDGYEVPFARPRRGPGRGRTRC